MADVSFKKTQWVMGTLLPVDENGNSAPFEAGSVQVISSNLDVCTVAPFGTEETNVKITGVSPGTSTLTFSLRALDGTTISGTALVEVTDTFAISVTMVFTAPQNQ